jgi:G3E family GTPase
MTLICGVLLRGILDDPNTDVMRMKGLVRCPQYVEVVMVQGIHQRFDMRLGDASKLQASTLVVIGRGLSPEAMLQGWADCQITPEG